MTTPVTGRVGEPCDSDTARLSVTGCAEPISCSVHCSSRLSRVTSHAALIPAESQVLSPPPHFTLGAPEQSVEAGRQSQAPQFKIAMFSAILCLFSTRRSPRDIRRSDTFIETSSTRDLRLARLVRVYSMAGAIMPNLPGMLFK